MSCYVCSAQIPAGQTHCRECLDVIAFANRLADAHKTLRAQDPTATLNHARDVLAREDGEPATHVASAERLRKLHAPITKAVGSPRK